LALERHTASAFHAMRATEVGLKAISQMIGVPYAPSWESHLKQLQSHIDSIDKSDAAQREDRMFYSEAAAQFGAIKDAWRNPVMHTVSRHSTESATEIFDAVRMFMRTLAKKIRE
jgi:hypothetical protein